MIIQARAASAKPHNAIIIVSLHLVLSCWREPKSILYAQMITKITAIVPAIHIKKSIADLIAVGISSRVTSHSLSFVFEIQRIFSAACDPKAIEKNNNHVRNLSIVFV